MRRVSKLPATGFSFQKELSQMSAPAGSDETKQPPPPVTKVIRDINKWKVNIDGTQLVFTWVLGMYGEEWHLSSAHQITIAFW